MRGWLGILSITLLFPIIMVIIVSTDGVIPFPGLSWLTTGEIVDSWEENENGDTYKWVTVEFEDGDKSATVNMRGDARVGTTIDIRYSRSLIGYRATCLTDVDILYRLRTWYIAESAILVPAFFLTLLLYMKRRRCEDA